MIKACIFDLDGTVANTINSIAYFANRALKKSGFAEIDTEKYNLLAGNGAKVLVQRMLETVGADAKYYDEVSTEYNTTYDNDFLYLTEPYEGIIDMLRGLKEQGIKVAILSNKPHSTTEKVAEALFPDGLIDICYGGRENVPLKPDPQGVFEIIDEFGFHKDECLYIGDTGTDMQTGKNAGLYTVGVLWGFRKEPELWENGADEVISQPCELLDIVKKFM